MSIVLIVFIGLVVLGVGYGIYNSFFKKDEEDYVEPPVVEEPPVGDEVPAEEEPVPAVELSAEELAARKAKRQARRAAKAAQ